MVCQPFAFLTAGLWVIRGVLEAERVDETHLLRNPPGGFHADDIQAVSNASAVLCDVLRPQAAEHPFLRAGKVALQLPTDGAAARCLGSADDTCRITNDTHSSQLPMLM